MASEPLDAGPPALQVDQALEREYNLRLRHPERGAVYERFSAESATLRASAPGFAELRYGESPNGLIDFFPAQVAGLAPLFVFIHGGYWRALDRRIFSFLARPWLARGVHVALPGYELAPAARVSEIAHQVQTALRWLRSHSQTLHIDNTRVIVSGHSAGAQLGALALNEAAGEAATAFVGISGVYALQPMLTTSINIDVRLDEAQAQALSPGLQPANPTVRYLCAVGEAETDGFREQSRQYVAALQSQGCDAQFLDVPARTHFDILDDLADANALLFRRAYELMPTLTGETQ